MGLKNHGEIYQGGVVCKTGGPDAAIRSDSVLKNRWT